MKFLSNAFSTLSFVAACQCTMLAQQATQSIPSPPVVSRALSKPLAQSKVLDCADASQLLMRGNRSFYYSQAGLEVKGTDLDGHTWSATTPASNILKCEVWAARLRSGMPEDLLFLTADETGGYASELTVLFFDKQGRPHPWQAKGAFTSTDAGIQQLALDPSTGNGRLVVPLREGDKFDGYAYIHNLYKMTPSGVSKVVVPDDANSWPSVSGNLKALVGTEKNITESDTFDSVPVPQAVSSLKLVNVLPKEDEPLAFSDGTKTRYPLIAVIDKADGLRRIFFDGDTPDAVAEMEKGSYRVQLKGSTCEEEECRPFILLAKESK